MPQWMRPSAPVRDALQAAERWLLPAECLLCEQPVDRDPADPLVCALCRSRWRPLPEPQCSRCGQPSDRDSACRICAGWPDALGEVRSAVWLDGGTRQAVHRLKYDGWWRLSESIALAMQRLGPLRGGGLLVPIPLSARRRRKRGYNQSEHLARGLAQLTGLSVDPNRLRRIREAGSQTALSPQVRRANVAGAFHASPSAGVRVVLVDDVFTTGATLSAAAEALTAAGAHEVVAVTFARARRLLG
jgi:ComF family protein